MVLTLIDLCLASLRDSIESGRSHDVHELPVNLRRSLLDTIALHGTIEYENCLRELTTAEFLRNILFLDIRNGTANDDQYLDRVCITLQGSPDGPSIANNLTSLSLNAYVCNYARYIGTEMVGTERPVEMHAEEVNIGNVVRLISICPNLSSLKLRLMWKEFSPRPMAQRSSVHWFAPSCAPSAVGGLLNRYGAFSPCIKIIENLKELTLLGNRGVVQFLKQGHPVIEFKQLSYLHVDCGRVDGYGWNQLLKHVRSTLTVLHVGSLAITRSKRNFRRFSSIPFPLPQLQHLNVDHPREAPPITPPLGETIPQCPELNRICLFLNANECDDSMSTLNGVQAEVNIGILFQLTSATTENEMIEGNSFKVVNQFRDRIFTLHFVLLGDDIPWNYRYTVALKDAVDTCSNLDNLGFRIIGHSPTHGTNENAQIRQAKWQLTRIFRNENRALKLRKLLLSGEFDDETLSLLFRNCLNLTSLLIENCPQLHDHHLIEWADRGAKPSSLRIKLCPNVSANGLIPVFANSSEAMSDFDYVCAQPLSHNAERIWSALFNHCPRVKRVNGFASEHFNGRVQANIFCNLDGFHFD